MINRLFKGKILKFHLLLISLTPKKHSFISELWKKEYWYQILTDYIIIEFEQKGIILSERAFPPHGWSIPGGFVDYGESLEEAAIRESLEETSLTIELI